MVGVITISLEIELGWGINKDVHPYIYLSNGRKKETNILEKLLNICDKFEIPITFDIVGKLFSFDNNLQCSKVQEDFNLDRPRWNAKLESLYYAPDILEKILDAEVSHEIGSHSFTHKIFNKTDKKELEEELKHVAKTHKDIGLNQPESFVPPKHCDVPYNILKKYGIKVIRTPIYSPPKSFRDQCSKRLTRWSLQKKCPVAMPKEKYGVIETYSTPYPSLTAIHLPNGQQKPLIPFRLMPIGTRQRIHKSFLERNLKKLVEEDSYLHLWSHLMNLSNDYQFAVIESFLETLSEYRDKQFVNIAKMQELESYVR